MVVPTQSSMDFRTEWFRKCIRVYFSENDEKLLDDFLNRDDGRMGKNFSSFLNDTIDVVDISKQVFVVYRTYYTRVVEEDVEVVEEGMYVRVPTCTMYAYM